MMPMLPSLDEIAFKRKGLGLTQLEIASICRVSRSLIAKLETGKVTPSYDVVKRIFNALEEIERVKVGRLSDITVGQIHNTSIEFARADEAVADVWWRMEEGAYSQMPVLDGDRIIGSLTERGVIRVLARLGFDKGEGLRVREVLEEPFPTVNVRTTIASIVGLLQTFQAVVTLEGKDIAGIVTNADLVKAFVSKTRDT